jgi:acyl carrier protein
LSKAHEDIIREEFRQLLRDDHEGDFDEMPLAELGVDSLDFFEVLMILEDEHGIVIPVKELHNTITLKEILQMTD